MSQLCQHALIFPPAYNWRTTQLAPARTAAEKSHTFTFFPGDLDFWPQIWTVDFCSVHLTTNFHHPTFHRWEVTVWQTKNRRWWKHRPCSAMLCHWIITNTMREHPIKLNKLNNS